MLTFKKGGIHPNDNKLTAGSEPQYVAAQGQLVIMTGQSIGAPSVPAVKTGDEVVKGQLIAKAGGFVSANIHAPASGKVLKIDKVRDPQGFFRDAIILEVTGDNATEGITCEKADTSAIKNAIDCTLSPKEIIAKVSEGGIVGLGGATFPTHVKLSVPEGKYVDTILINGAECEPFLTCDDMLMRNHPYEIVAGAVLIAKASGAEHIVIGIESNKPEAIAAMREAASQCDIAKVVVLKKKYPQGGEKQLIDAITRREVPDGCLPVDVHCIVDNVATAASIYNAVIKDKPLTRRTVTVTGPTFKGGNYNVPVGMKISELLSIADVDLESAGKVIAGGPMMGRAVSNVDAPVTKGLGGLLILPPEMAERHPAGPCIRCGKCVDVCPMGLEPYLFMIQAQAEEWDGMASHHVMSCVECGSCSYTCPAARPLLDYIKLGKLTLRNRK